ncbi:macrophage mannose receptor 1-like [Denticeps clupeoides]|uniref:macrophage mannose receptor 1-like n=1 Tax=Denticeps clupeoides TaxID=299321 RepID=UPI0010A52D2E|nr:macrophage mannose receptor 1-like [Denticeps clupeoides]
MKQAVVFITLITALCAVVGSLKKEHFFINTSRNWYDAVSFCRSYYTELSTFNSIEEVRDFDDFQTYAGPYWTGLVKWNKNLMFTEDGNWNAVKSMFTVSGNSGDNSCLFLQQHQATYDSCYTNRPFYCYQYMRKMIVVNENKTWDQALDYCRQNYTDLASVLTDREMIVAVRRSWGQDQVWIALRFVVKYWLWISGDALEYEVWSGGQQQCPVEGYYCGALSVDNNVWMNQTCDQPLNFICYQI